MSKISDLVKAKAHIKVAIRELSAAWDYLDDADEFKNDIDITCRELSDIKDQIIAQIAEIEGGK